MIWDVSHSSDWQSFKLYNLSLHKIWLNGHANFSQITEIKLIYGSRVDEKQNILKLEFFNVLSELRFEL